MNELRQAYVSGMSLRNELSKGAISLADIDSSSASSGSGSINQDKSDDGNNEINALIHANPSHSSYNSNLLADMASEGSKKYPCNVPNALRRSNVFKRTSSPIG